MSEAGRGSSDRFELRIQDISPAETTVPKLLSFLAPGQPVNRTIVQDIYEDDGRGNIRDFVFARYTAGNAVIEVIHERSSGWIVNLRFVGGEIQCEQVPSIAGAPLRFVGETSSRYLLTAPRHRAELILRLLTIELERWGLEGYKTDEDRRLDEARIKRILEGRDPHLVLLKFRDIEYAQGKTAAFEFFDRAAAELPEFAAALGRLRAMLRPGTH